MEDQELQRRLVILVWLIEQGWIKFTSKVPKTIAAFKSLRRGPDGTFDLKSVEPPIRAMCNMLEEIVDSLPPDMMKGEPVDLPALDLPDPKRDRTSLDEFMEDLVNVGNRALKYLRIAAAAVPLRPLSPRARLVLTGSMVRLSKLYDTLLYLVTGLKGEATVIIVRPLVETAITIRFLVKRDDEQLYEEYVKKSLVFEKMLWTEIEARKKRPPSPIEDRMQRSIERLFKNSGYTLDQVSRRDDRNRWPDVAARARETGDIGLYELLFRPTSHALHGTWSDLIMHHLRKDASGYHPALDYDLPKPAAIEGPSVVCLSAAEAYLSKTVGKPARELISALRTLSEWFRAMALEHEAWDLKQKRPPRGSGDAP